MDCQSCPNFPRQGDDIITCALLVLQEPDPHRKAELTNVAVELWRKGLIEEVDPCIAFRAPPDRPARSDDKVKLVAPKDLPKRKKGGSLASRQALLHSLCHIESWAVDLAWDIIARFGQDPSYLLPPQFFDDFVTVAEDECRHFLLLEKRLKAIGSSYGALPAHDGLWESAMESGGSLAARLAVEHCAHEARGLDVLPQTIHRFRSNGDEESAALLENVIYSEEISHCAAGVRWLRHLHAVANSWQDSRAAQQAQHDAAEEFLAGLHLSDEQTQHAEPCRSAGTACEACSSGEACTANGASGGCRAEATVSEGRSAGGVPQASMPEWVRDARSHPTVEHWFHTLIRRHFRGPLKPPFNDEARAKAGFGPEWYLPLAQVAPEERMNEEGQ